MMELGRNGITICLPSIAFPGELRRPPMTRSTLFLAAFMFCTFVNASPCFAVYNATQGRWLTRDPIGSRPVRNLYAYARSNPVRAVDPSGRQAVPPLPPPAIVTPAQGPTSADILFQLRNTSAAESLATGASECASALPEVDAVAAVL